MKKLITIMIAGALAASFATSAFAQGAGPRGGGVQGGQGGIGGGKGQRQGGGMRMMKMQQELMAKLNLTTAQKTKIEAINKKFADDMKTLREKAKTGDRKALQPEFRKAQMAHREEIAAVLTAEQKKKYQEEMKAMMEKMRKERGGDGKWGQNGKGGKAGKGGAGAKGSTGGGGGV
jgi:Spy/CpxP family protein refolding chaperone